MTANVSNRNRIHGLVPSALSEVDSLFDTVFGSEGFRPTAGLRAPLSVWEADEQYHIELDVPGVAQEDIDLTFDKGSLKISVERKAPEEDRKNWHNERMYGKLTRSVSLPESANPEAIDAELNAGVLHVTVAKIPEAQPKRIKVKAAG